MQHAKRKQYEDSLGHVVLEGEQLDNVYTFEYLGCRIQSDGDEKADINHRMFNFLSSGRILVASTNSGFKVGLPDEDVDRWGIIPPCSRDGDFWG